MVHLLEVLNVLVERVDDRLDLLKLVLSESIELLHGTEEFHELANSPAEEIETTEDLLGREVELLASGHVHESLLGELVLFLVSSIQVNARLHERNEFTWRIISSLPKHCVILRSTFLGGLTLAGELEVENGVLARFDHRGGDLAEETGHPVVGAVVTSDGVNHLDGVHKSGKNFLDALRSSVIKRLNEFVESLKILDIILGFIELFGDSEIESEPFGGSEGNAILGSGTTGFVRGILVSGEASSNNLAVPRAELLGDTGEFSHLLFPEVDLILGSSILVVSGTSLRLVKSVLDVGGPSLEKALEVLDHLVDLGSLSRSALKKHLDLWIIFLGVGLQLDVVVDGVQGLSELLGELLEDLVELLLRVLLALLPVGLGQAVNHGLEALVDGSVQGGDGVL